MPFRPNSPARTSALVAFAILAGSFLAYGKGPEKKLSAYDMIVVEPVVVAPGAAKNFPMGLDAAIRARMAEELRKKKLFQDVEDQTAPLQQKASPIAGPSRHGVAASGPSDFEGETQTVEPQEMPHKLVLSSTVEKFSKGNMAARVLVGFGAGESKITLHFVLHDAATGAEIMQFDQEASWSGDLSFTGGTPNEAARGAADNAVKGLIKEIQKNR
jgi:hypothetical protein